MASSQFEKKPQPGDLIEIFRGTYQHWGIYVGDGFIIHLAPPPEHAEAGDHSKKSLLSDRAVVKKEQLWDVAGSDEYTINNLLDEKYEPLPVHVILREACRLLGRMLPYGLFTNNCEHFVTELRYGKAESRQVRKAVEKLAACSVAEIFVGAVAFAVFLPGKKEKRTK